MNQWAVILHIDAEDDYTRSDLEHDMKPVFLPPGVELMDIEVTKDEG